ncbi:MAG: PAS domain-containing sensor histidine kinase [Opitutaceae bacterium]|nr:PAS domain-containing sensor histidine kinase [Opitutaceae bacterium]
MTTSPMPSLAEDRPAQLEPHLVAAFLEQVPDLVYFKDRDCRFIAVSNSKARRHNLTPEQMIGLSDADFFSAEHAREARQVEETIMANGKPIVGQTDRITWSDGREGWVVTTKLPLRDAHGTIIGTMGITKDVTASHLMQKQLEATQRSLVEASRMAGMAEVATGVLHNVGNVLNSLNVSATVVADGLRQSKAESLGKLAALLNEHAADLGTFLTTDPRGRRVPELLTALSQQAIEQRDRLAAEIVSLQKNIDHIKEIVVLQQSYATMGGLVEPLDAEPLMEDSLRMNAGALVRHAVDVTRDYQTVPRILGERAKILQILVNLIRNAKYACDETGQPGKLITLRIAPAPTSGRVRLIVSDNGVGIPPENLSRIFGHGFTTRVGGHGFGLHSAACAASEMKGSLTVESAGRGLGATFILELPVAA